MEWWEWTKSGAVGERELDPSTIIRVPENSYGYCRTSPIWEVEWCGVGGT